MNSGGSATGGRSTTAGGLSIRAVSKSFPNNGTSLRVLQSVSLEVKAAEFISLIGLSGCGKTTLLRIVAGLEKLDSGEVWCEAERSGGGRVPKGVGFVFQGVQLLPWRTVFENVRVGLIAQRLDAKEQARRVEFQLELAGLSAFRTYYPYQLSGGMQQRVGVARALVGEPKVLLMDEPFGALDAFTRMRLQEEMGHLVRESKATTLFVTHDVDEAMFLADRVVVMATDPGRIVLVEDIPLERPRVRRDFLLDGRINKLREKLLSTIAGEGTPGEQEQKWY